MLTQRRSVNGSISGSSIAHSTISTLQRDSSLLSNGVIYEYYQGEFDTIPAWHQIEPTRKGITPNIHIDSFTEMGILENSDLDPSSAQGDYAIRFQTLLKIPVDGLWTFSTTSNDGSTLHISGRKVVDNDGSHYSTEKSGKIRLKAGIYPVDIGFYHQSGKVMEGIRTGAFLSVSFYCASATWLSYGHDFIGKQNIPASLLFYDGLKFESNFSTSGDPIYANINAQTLAMQSQIQTLQGEIEVLHSERDSFIMNCNDSMGTTCSESYENVVNSISALKQNYFFALGLGAKISSGCKYNLQDLWERVVRDKIPIQVCRD